MIHLKIHNTKSGFMLMEVLLAVGLLGAALTTLFYMQGIAMRSLSKKSERFRLTIAMKNLLTEKMFTFCHDEKREVKLELKDKMTGATMQYDRRKIKKELPVFKKKIEQAQLEHLSEQQVIVKQRTETEKMVSFLYKPFTEKK